MSYKCNSCGKKEYTVLYPAQGIVQCQNCGLVSLLTLPNEDELCHLYDQEYSTGESFNQFYTHLAVVRKTEAGLRLRSIRRLSKGHDLLDVGSGMGYFVETALEHGWNAQGIEISTQAVSLQADRNLPIVNCPYESFEPGNLYDVITLWAVIEHVRDPRQVLAKTYALLKPGGIVVIETGDLLSRNASKDGVEWRMFYIAGHLYFFSSACLDRMLEEIGFKVLETRLDKWVEHTLMQNRAEGSLLTANRILPRSLVKLVSWLKSYVNGAMAGLGLGDVMIKVAQKPEG